MKTKFTVDREFILQAHLDACFDWKQKLEDKFPEAFEKGFEIGKWYKRKRDRNVLVNYQGGKSGYGFNFLKEWYNNDNWSFQINPNAWRPATDKEVEEALINEAKKRGFKDIDLLTIKASSGYKFRAGYFNNDGNHFHYEDDELSLDGVTIYKAGRWAEILERENPTLKRIKEIEAELKELKSKL